MHLFAPSRRTLLMLAMIGAGTGVGCDGSTAPYPAFDLEGRWNGALAIDATPFEVTIDVSPGRCRSSLELQSLDGAVERTVEVGVDYNPPVVVIQPCRADEHFASFAGEIHQANRMQGSFFVSDVTDEAAVVLALVPADERGQR